MANPRIVVGKKGSSYALGARGHIDDVAFLIGVARAVPIAERPRLEDALMEEARSILRIASGPEPFDWAGKGFTRDAEFGVWHKILSADELRRLSG